MLYEIARLRSGIKGCFQQKLSVRIACRGTRLFYFRLILDFNVCEYFICAVCICDILRMCLSLYLPNVLFFIFSLCAFLSPIMDLSICGGIIKYFDCYCVIF